MTLYTIDPSYVRLLSSHGPSGAILPIVPATMAAPQAGPMMLLHIPPGVISAAAAPAPPQPLRPPRPLAPQRNMVRYKHPIRLRGRQQRKMVFAPVPPPAAPEDAEDGGEFDDGEDDLTVPQQFTRRKNRQPVWEQRQQRREMRRRSFGGGEANEEEEAAAAEAAGIRHLKYLPPTGTGVSKYPPESVTVFVSGIRVNETRDEIANRFGAFFDDILGCRPIAARGVAFVRFRDVASATAAMNVARRQFPELRLRFHSQGDAQVAGQQQQDDDDDGGDM